MKKNFLSHQSGRNMIEMLGVLAIIAVISAGGLVGYSKAMRRHRLNETMNQIAHMVISIHSFYGNSDSYESLTEQNAVRYNMITQRMVGVGNTLVNEYKGRVTITIDKALRNGPDKTAFIITYRDLPVEACVTMATTDWGLGEKVGLIGVSVGADDEDPNYPYKPTEYFKENQQIYKLTMSEAIEHCSGSDPNASRSTIAWKYF